jgi:hypothetical protein
MRSPKCGPYRCSPGPRRRRSKRPRTTTRSFIIIIITTIIIMIDDVVDPTVARQAPDDVGQDVLERAPRPSQGPPACHITTRIISECTQGSFGRHYVQAPMPPPPVTSPCETPYHQL